MNYFNNIALNEKGQMMTIEAFLGALLIITALLFVVSQVPPGVQQADAQSKTQLTYYAKDTIGLLKNSHPPSNTGYDNYLQYYLSEKKFDEMNEFFNDTLPDNVVYNIELYDGGRYLPIIRNGYPSANGISFNEIIIAKGAPAGGIGHLTGTSITYESFGNGSLIIPMDEQQNNNITAYNLILRISGLGIPVYQLLMDPRGNNFNESAYPVNTTDKPWSECGITNLRSYAGGPYVIDAEDLTPIFSDQIKDWAENPIDVPSGKIDEIEFNDSMVNNQVNITFTLSNGSSKIINLNAGTSTITSVDGADSGNDSEFLDIDTASIAFDDCNKSKIIGIVIFNRAPFNLTISNITLESSNRQVSNITIDKKEYSASSSTVEVDIDLLHNDAARKVTVHKIASEFSYPYTTWLTGSPRIAVYPKDGTMRNYYSDSGISYTVLSNGNILNGDLHNYDILIMPHINIIETSLSNDSVVENIIKWVSDGGVLLAECDSLKKIDDRVEEVDQENHTWHGFIGVTHQENFNTNNTIQFVGRSLDVNGDTFGHYLINYTEKDGSYLHPLAQSYTGNGTLPGTDGTVSAFWLNNTLSSGNINPDNSILAVPQGTGSGGLAYPKVTFIEAPFDKGTVIYLAGHDQSTLIQQQERLIFNSILYSTTAKVYSYGLLEIRITMWYK